MKNKLKYFIIFIFIIFVTINVFMYISFYSNYISITNNEKLKDARIEMINAQIFSFYEILAIKSGIDFRSVVLEPIQKAKKYFYYRGLNKFEEDEPERAYWFGILIFTPIYLSMNAKSNKYESITKEYGIDFSITHFYNLSTNLKLLSKYSVNKNKNKYINDKLVWVYFSMFTAYLNSYNLNPRTFYYTTESKSSIEK